MRVWATLVLLSLAVAVFAADPIVPAAEWPETSWVPQYQTATNSMTAYGLLVGYPDLTIKPKQLATRYEVAGVLSRLVWFFNVPLPEREYLPPDVPWNHWAADACMVLTGSRLNPLPYGENFHGDRAITRAEFSYFVWNLCQGLQGKLAQANVKGVEDPYVQAAEKLRDLGILEGYPDGELHPEARMPRWQVCLAAHRLMLWNEELNGPRVWSPVKYMPDYVGRRNEFRPVAQQPEQLD